MAAKKNVRSAQFTPTISTSAFTAGDAMHTGAIEIEDILQFNGSGHIKTVVVSDEDAQEPDFDILFFKALPTGTITANSALAIDDASLADFIGYGSLRSANYVSLSDNSVGGKEMEIAFSKNLLSPLGASGASTRSLWCVLVCQDTSNFTAADALVVTVTIETD